jgi:hypothetical protein
VVELKGGTINGQTGIIEIPGASPGVEFKIIPNSSRISFKIWVYDTEGNVYDPSFSYLITKIEKWIVENKDAVVILTMLMTFSVVTLSAFTALGALVLAIIWGVIGWFTQIFTIIEIVVAIMIAIAIYLLRTYL